MIVWATGDGFTRGEDFWRSTVGVVWGRHSAENRGDLGHLGVSVVLPLF